MVSEESTVRVAALGDIHVNEHSSARHRDLLTSIARDADILVLCGDLTNRGLPNEATALADALRGVSIPVLAVLGNHDFESGQADEVAQILCQAGVMMLDDQPQEVCGIGFAGAVGFVGGFDSHALAPFGEDLIKRLVHETVDQALKLESGLARLRAKHRVCVLHYAPIRETVVGEPPEIFPFLGCSRLVDPIDRLGVDLVVHGHAHHGTHAGTTPRGIPVYNVAEAIMREIDAERPYLVVEL
jgi:Icc-related predicted phosphoesterase